MVAKAIHTTDDNTICDEQLKKCLPVIMMMLQLSSLELQNMLFIRLKLRVRPINKCDQSTSVYGRKLA